MIWQAPETEEAWEECLSAYFDGEMSSDDKTELENILKSNLKRATQLEDLKETSNLLREWNIQAPVPDADFISEVRKQYEPARRRLLSARWRVWPLAASAVLAFFLIIFWHGGSPVDISWADVLEHLEQIRTMTSKNYIEITTPAGKRIIYRYKVYHKDPGLSRSEQYAPDSDFDSSEPESITIAKSEPGLEEILTLYPDSHRAERTTIIFRNNGSEPPSRPKIDLASWNWELFKDVTADKTKRIGNRVVGGMPVVGFTFELPREYIPLDMDGNCHGQLWASRDDAIPLFGELEYRNIQGQNVRYDFSDIRWNVPLDEGLFDLTVPAGWNLSRTRTEFAEYSGTGLAPGVTLKISLDGEEPLAATRDVAVVQVMQTTNLDSNIPETTQVTIDLKPEAARTLHDYADAHPDKIIIVNFNGQIKVAGRCDTANPTQLSFDLSLLDLSLSELETRYFTATAERRNLP